jgi:hypothetical protein
VNAITSLISPYFQLCCAARVWQWHELALSKGHGPEPSGTVVRSAVLPPLHGGERLQNPPVHSSPSEHYQNLPTLWCDLGGHQCLGSLRLTAMEICWEPAGLPEAIWAQAARHLSIKEYARVAGTCKIFSELAPTVDVCIDAQLTEDGTATPGGSILVCVRCICRQLLDHCLNVHADAVLHCDYTIVPSAGCM